MMKRSVAALIVGCVVASAAGVASCSFPTYNIIVTGSGGASASSASSGSVGGAGGASTTASSGGAASTSTTSSTGSGPCSTDADSDTAISWQCAGGKDCADQDNRAHPGADFTAGAPIIGPRSPGTLAYDFDCDTFEKTKYPKLICPGVCVVPGTVLGFVQEVSCGMTGTLGHCAGSIKCAWVSDGLSTMQTCK